MVRTTCGLLFVLVLVGTGCMNMSSGRMVAKKDVEQIEHGVTTEAEIRKKFGTPMSESITDSSGGRMLIYSASKRSGDATNFMPVVGAFHQGYNDRQQTLQVMIKNGVVTDHVFSDQSARTTGSVMGGQRQVRDTN